MDQTTDNTAALVEAADDGSIEAFAELTRRHQEMALGCAVAMLGDFHLAQDATQDAFLAAWCNLHKLEEPSAFSSWPRGIVRHCCHRVLRRGDLEWISLSGASADLRMPQFDLSISDEHSEGREMRQWMVRAVNELPPGLREVVELFYLKECSQAQVAAFLSLPVSTVNNRLHTARNVLKKRMTMTMMSKPVTEEKRPNAAENIGRILEIQGPAVTVQFESGPEPDIFDAIAIADEEGQAIEAMKVAQRLGDGKVRCLSTTGSIRPLQVGTNVMNTRAVGVGLTPWMSVTPLADEQIEPAAGALAGARPAEMRLLETGIKPIDLFCPCPQGGRVGLFGIQGVGADRSGGGVDSPPGRGAGGRWAQPFLPGSSE